MSTDAKRIKRGATTKKRKSTEVLVEQIREKSVEARSPTPVAESSSEDYEDVESEVPLDDLEDVPSDEDIVLKRKVEIDNEVGCPFAKRATYNDDFRAQVALRRIRETIQLDPSLPWTETLVISCPQAIEVDVDDDLNRELAL
jgi:rRNA-processing protein EBP2